MTPPSCAAPDCDNPVARRPGAVGRPPIYCSPACRPSRHRPTVSVEVDRHDGGDDDQPSRDWIVRLRRGHHAVIVAAGVGRFTAAALAADLRSLLNGTPPRSDA